MEIYHHHYNFC